MHRRDFLATATASALVGSVSPGMAAASSLKVTLLGQALIEHDVLAGSWPGRLDLAARLASADAGFTNLETVIRGPRAGAPTRELLTLHAAGPEVIETLKAMNVTLAATANNHAFDLGTGGILDTLAALRAAGLPSAGTGNDLAGATAPAYHQTPHGTVALVACATGKVREGGAATPTRPGVNEVRRDASGQVAAADATRVLDALSDAARRADVVIAYQHNHDWEPDMARVPDWQRVFARRCVDAGASVFVGHGAPLLQGMEVYRGAPVIYGLGNFIFQTEKPPGAYPPEAWEGVLVECEFSARRCRSVRLVPIRLNEIGRAGPDDLATRGMPSLASGSQALAILDRIADRSLALGGRLLIGDGTDAQLQVP
ncbi:CapA family protein [Caulobacter henricii]|uniref:Capsule biosynthesis protein CapA n=1 Tax=Caulobacter henricii TaxID=69395 RepID=A0A0P0NYN0_9CAUL|nr:CapA family protein [Caulobacter henricii]ALL13197.1 capsule biosynthesis protein CapA [Caulobacter henricii]